MNLETIASLVDWQAAEIHITSKGKQKPVMTGIPTRRFWDAWKTAKPVIREAGISVSYEKVHKTRETATGQVSRAGGSYRQPRQAKAWTVTAWLGKRNADLVTLAGFAMPEIAKVSTEGIDCPF